MAPTNASLPTWMRVATKKTMTKHEHLYGPRGGHPPFKDVEAIMSLSGVSSQITKEQILMCFDVSNAEMQKAIYKILPFLHQKTDATFWDPKGNNHFHSYQGKKVLVAEHGDEDLEVWQLKPTEEIAWKYYGPIAGKFLDTAEGEPFLWQKYLAPTMRLRDSELPDGTRRAFLNSIQHGRLMLRLIQMVATRMKESPELRSAETAYDTNQNLPSIPNGWDFVKDDSWTRWKDEANAKGVKLRKAKVQVVLHPQVREALQAAHPTARDNSPIQISTSMVVPMNWFFTNAWYAHTFLDEPGQNSFDFDKLWACIKKKQDELTGIEFKAPFVQNQGVLAIRVKAAKDHFFKILDSDTLRDACFEMKMDGRKDKQLIFFYFPAKWLEDQDESMDDEEEKPWAPKFARVPGGRDVDMSLLYEAEDEVDLTC